MVNIQHTPTPFFQFEHLSTYPSIKHFISTRQGGVSSAPFDSLNLSFKHDHPAHVLENRSLLSKSVNIPLEYFCFAQQSHGNEVYIVKEEDRGRGALEKNTEIPMADALVTNFKNICLTVTSADCVPLLLYDPVQEVVAAVHSGWRGTVLKIATETVSVMMQEFGCQPQHILVGIGPCISRTNYEVGEDVIEAVHQAYKQAGELLPYTEKTQKRHFDLLRANLVQLEELQIPAQNIETTGICTYEAEELFFSYRRVKNKVGIFGSGIMLSGPE